MSDSISIDLGSALPYLEEKIRGLFAKDAQTKDATELLERQARLAVRDAATVQIVGMDRPVAITEIYQPTRLVRIRKSETTTFEALIESRASAVVFGRPGAGKTVLLHYVFGQLSKSKRRVPALFTLRRSGAPEDLLQFVEHVVNRKLRIASNAELVLLVDGYDEVSADVRKQISEALREFQSLHIGPFFLTCRSHYPIDDTGAGYFEIAPFTKIDSYNFLVAFSKAYDSPLDPASLLRQLSQRGFDDFVAHPLMLALVCILKAGPMRALPRTAIGLLRRAVDTLTFRWDESKGVSRDTKLALDGDDRVRCMMKVAFAMKQYFEKDTVVQHVVADYLKLLQRPDIATGKLLDEIAQWYGMLVPVADDQWTFAHRTIHDYLAARFWVESGTFTPSRVNTWNARAAYAACLLPDATASLVRALSESRDIAAFVECLYNGARFNVEDVADAVIQHFESHGGYSCFDDGRSATTVETTKDFFGLASDEFLIALAAQGLRRPTSEPHKVVLWLALHELAYRGADIPGHIRASARRHFARAKVLRIRRFDVITKTTLDGLAPDLDA